MEDFDRLQSVMLKFLGEQLNIEGLDDWEVDSLLIALFKAYEYGVDSERLRLEGNNYVH